MKNVILLLILMVICVGCDDHDSPALKPGEFVIKVYDADDELLFAKKDNVEIIGLLDDDGWEIRMLDSSFGTQNSDPRQTFASLTLFGKTAVDAPQHLSFNGGSTAALHQMWYSSGQDWTYVSNSGRLMISRITETSIDGYFEVTLNTDETGNQNQHWGTQVTVKGSFSGVPFTADH